MLWLQLFVAADNTLNFWVNRTEHPAAAHQQRVALLTAAYDQSIDGVALTLNRLVAHLLRQGHEVLVFVPASGKKQTLTSAGAPVVRVPSLRCPIWSEYRLTLGLGKEARRRLSEFQPTVVHVAIQDGMGHAAQRWATRRGIPVVCSHHTRFERYLSYYGLGGVLERLYWFGMRRFHSQCAATLPPSESLRADLQSHGIPRVGVWPRGVDRTLFQEAARMQRWRDAVAGDPSAPIVLLVARLRWEKGLGTFARVITALNMRGVRHRVAVVGDGPARHEFSRLLPSSACFRGTLTGAELAEAYASSDIFLYPSTTEGWGATCLEAQSAGLPVVATASSGIVEVVEHGVGGLLVAPHNVSALADAVESLVADRELRLQMGQRASRHAERFSWEASGDRMLCEYAKHAAVVEPRCQPGAVGKGAAEAANGSVQEACSARELSSTSSAAA